MKKSGAWSKGMSNVAWWSIVTLCAAIGGGLSACAGGGETEAGPPPGGDATVDGDETSGFDPDASDSFGGKKVVKITVDPDGKTITVVNGDTSVPTASISYNATATLDDGSTVPLPSCTWTVDRIDLGAFVGSTLKASGGAGGTGKVTCSAAGLTGTATFSVVLEDSSDTSGLSDGDKKGLLGTVASDATVKQLLYPYDQTVFPRGLPSPELMWTEAAPSDAYALRVEEPGMTFTSFFKSPTPGRVTIPQATWNKLLDTATPTTPLKVTLFRLAGGAGGTPLKSVSQSWTIAAANLKGTIYYWRINGGKVVRIKPGASAPEDFLKLTTGYDCVACHSVSHDGSTLVASLEPSSGGPLPWSTFDAKTGDTKYFSSQNSGFQAVYPDGSLVAWGQAEGTGILALANASGASLEPSGIGAFGSAVHPTWSPDGKLFAFGKRNDGNWADFTDSDLSVSAFDLPTKKFGAPKVLRAGKGRVLTYPTFSPDSSWIAYMDGATSARPGLADLRMMKADGTSDVELTKASNAGVAAIDQHHAFEPNFSPLLSGGYFWVVFVSSRQFGNRMNITYDAYRDKCGTPSWDKSPCRRKQLWVAAIDASPKPGVDPSHPAFWLPGQDLNDQNMRGYWALDPCKKLGEGCEAGFECCEGTCKSEDGKSPKICVKPPPGKCRELGDKCAVDADCCEHELGVQCIGGVCGKKLPS